MKCPRCQQESPPKAKFCLGCGTPLSDVIITGRSYADLQAEIDGLRRELGEALEQQTATSEILRAISASPTDLQGVLDTVAASAARLCNSVDAQIFRIDGTMLRIAASYGEIPKTTSAEARPISRGSVNGRAVVDRQTIHVHDLAAESDTEFPVGKAYQKLFGHRTVVATPLLREGTPIGAITIRRMEVRPFSEKEITLLETFADQAVIAIANVRLFTELQERNRALTEAHAQIAEALDRQMATSEILRVISTSPTDLQPVFDAIVRNAVRLCGASHGGVYRFDGELVHSVAHDGYTPEQLDDWRKTWPKPATAPSVVCQAIRTRSLVRIADVMAADSMNLPSEMLENLRARRARSILTVPMFRRDEVIGGISLAQREVGGFSDSDVELLKTFADQAVIAIENVRLFKELQARNRDLSETLDRQSATADVLRIIAQSPTELQPVLNAIAASAMRLCAASDAVIERLEGDRFYNAAHAGAQMKGLVGLPLPLTRGFPGGRAVLDRRRVIIDDVHLVAESEYPDSLELLRLNTIHSLAEIPLLSEGKPLGSLAVLRAEVRPFTDAEVALLETFASQAVIAIENVRLFTELQEKNREVELKSHELEAASRHKSEFLANMSHELRTPLNAVIGFSEVLTERMFGELNAKQDEYVRDIYASGTHLLSLINDILDLSKIEAGRMELELADFHLPEAIENALVLVRERALRRGITLEQSIDPGLSEIQGDERKIKQVLLNLLSNAIKFTPEGGRVGVRAEPVDEHVEVAVSDTGVGIASEDHEAVVEEFRQVGAAEKRAEGTGLGLALARKFIELHGGRIWVKSQVGAGSTFTFTLPVRRGE